MSFSFAKLNQICNEIALNFTRRKRKHPHVLVHLYFLSVNLNCSIVELQHDSNDRRIHLNILLLMFTAIIMMDKMAKPLNDGQRTIGKKWTHNYKRFVCWFNGIFVMANTMLTMLMHILNYSIPPFLNMKSQERCFNFIFVLNFSLFSPLSPSNGDWISKCWIKFSQN